MTGRRKSISATDLIAKLQGGADLPRIVQAGRSERQLPVQISRSAEQPIVADLRDVGVEVESVWDLVNTSTPYPGALPVLLKHLEQGGYPEGVMESLGRALAVKPAVTYWNRLRAQYLAAKTPGEEHGVAVALAASATRAQFEDLVSFLRIDDRGDSRIYFLRPIKRVGGERGKKLLASLENDPTLGREARALLGKRA